MEHLLAQGFAGNLPTTFSFLPIQVKLAICGFHLAFDLHPAHTGTVAGWAASKMPSPGLTPSPVTPPTPSISLLSSMSNQLFLKSEGPRAGWWAGLCKK